MTQKNVKSVWESKNRLYSGVISKEVAAGIYPPRNIRTDLELERVDSSAFMGLEEVLEMGKKRDINFQKKKSWGKKPSPETNERKDV